MLENNYQSNQIADPKTDTSDTTEKAKIPTRDELMNDCKEVVEAPNVLARFDEHLRGCGFAGETKHANLLYLAGLTSLTKEPVSVVVKGKPAGGKSHLVKSVLNFFPPNAVVSRSGVSEKAFIFTDEDFKHRILVIEEFAGLQSETGNPWLRGLLSAHKLSYEVTTKAKKGEYRTQKIDKEGPTGLIMTTTAGELHPEDESRLLSIKVDDTPEQTSRVLLAQARSWGKKEANPPNFDEWHSFHQWIAAGARVVEISFAEAIAMKLDTSVLGMKRAFPHLLSLIGAHTLAHQWQRAKREDGTIIATLDDYAAVRDLVDDTFAGTIKINVPSQVQHLVEAVTSITENRPEYSEGVTQILLVEKLGCDKGTVSRQVDKALKTPYLENAGEGEGHAHKLRPGEPLPTRDSILPSVEAIKSALDNAKVANG